MIGFYASYINFNRFKYIEMSKCAERERKYKWNFQFSDDISISHYLLLDLHYGYIYYFVLFTSCNVSDFCEQLFHYEFDEWFTICFTGRNLIFFIEFRLVSLCRFVWSWLMIENNKKRRNDGKRKSKKQTMNNGRLVSWFTQLITSVVLGWLIVCYFTFKFALFEYAEGLYFFLGVSV